MKRIQFSLCMIAAIFCSASVMAFPVSCPERIEVEQRLRVIPQKWEQFQSNAAVHVLDGVTFYSGHPKEQASLVPEPSKKNAAQWKFSSQDKIYVSCSYAKTSMEVIQILPAVKRCNVTFDENQQGFVPKKIECK